MRRALALALAALVVGTPAAEAAKAGRCGKGDGCRAAQRATPAKPRCAKGVACRITRLARPAARGTFGALVGVARRPAPPAAGGPPAAPAARPAPAPPVTAPREGAPPADTPVAAPAPVPPVAPPAVVRPAPARLQVTAREWSLTLSRPSLSAGPALVELVNRGEDGHDLRIVAPAAAAATWDELAPGATKRQAVDLPAGDYVLLCSLPGHREAGMQAALTVTS